METRFENKIIVYGTGSCAEDIVRDDRYRPNVAAVVSRDTTDNGSAIFGVPWENDRLLLELDQDVDLILASQYFDSIYERLESEGKLADTHIKGIYVPALLMNKPPYGEVRGGTAITEEEWRWLDTQFKDSDSKELLKAIKEARFSANYPAEKIELVPYQDGKYHSGREDYWDTIPVRRGHSEAVVIDGGAYIGDTVEKLVSNIGPVIKKYYAFEPMTESYNILSTRTYPLIQEFIPVKCAIGAEAQTVTFRGSSRRLDGSSLFDDNPYLNRGDEKEESVNVISIDSLSFRDTADYFIKLDVEGSELDVLKGGEEFIKAKHPNLAICLYHRGRDLIEIPRYIKLLDPSYVFYLVGGSHTILIAQ